MRARVLALMLVPLLVPVIDPRATNADTLASTSTYYRVRPDPRDCIFPLCGGVFVSRVNRKLTRCADRHYNSECYVPEIDWSQLGLSEERTAEINGTCSSGRCLLRGRIEAKDYFNLGNLGVFVATEAWRAATDSAPSGTFVRLYDNGIRCITFPCFSIHEAVLNRRRHTNLSDVDFSQVGATPEQIEAAWQAIATTSLLAAGTNVIIPDAGPAGRGKVFVGSQFYAVLR